MADPTSTCGSGTPTSRTTTAHDVVRTGAKHPYSYASGEWTDVEGDQRRFKKGFWR
jgi:hypothetical protein